MLKFLKGLIEMLLSLSTIALSILLALVMSLFGETDVTFAVGLFIFGFIGLVSSSVDAYKRALRRKKACERRRRNKSLRAEYKANRKVYR